LHGAWSVDEAWRLTAYRERITRVAVVAAHHPTPCRRLGLRAADCEVVRAERQAGKCRDGPDELALLHFIRLGDAVNSVSASREITITLNDDGPRPTGWRGCPGIIPHGEKRGPCVSGGPASIHVLRRPQSAGA